MTSRALAQKIIVWKAAGMTETLHPMEKVGNVDDLLLNAIDETLRQIFREAGTKVIFDYMENKYHLKREEIAEKPEVFSIGLQKLLISAAQVIEALILKNSYHKAGLKFIDKKGYEFPDYISELREKLSVEGQCGQARASSREPEMASKHLCSMDDRGENS